MLNIIYCFDENYNIQAITSIFSLLENTSVKVNLYIVHKDLKALKSNFNLIRNHENLNSINEINFEFQAEFPNLKGSHVSEATYYRLFLEDFIPSNLKNILYMDADIVCISDPAPEIQKVFEDLDKSEKTVAVAQENLTTLELEDISNRLEIDSSKYFNAGVMFIDLDRWRKKSVKKDSLNIIKKKNAQLKYWDQDVLNILFSQDHKIIEHKFNFNINIEDPIKLPNGILFLHYAGSFKPWTVRGALEKNSIYYMNTYRQHSEKKFHITHTWKYSSLLHLIKGIVNLKIINTKYPFLFFKEVIKSFLD